jgi:hypothetical protein
VDHTNFLSKFFKPFVAPRARIPSPVARRLRAAMLAVGHAKPLENTNDVSRPIETTMQSVKKHREKQLHFASRGNRPF